MAASARNASQSSGARPEAPSSSSGGSPCRVGSSGPEAPRSGAGSRGRAPAATMGRGEGAIDKNMRKELILEIDGHSCAPVRESNVAAWRMASKPSTRR